MDARFVRYLVRAIVGGGWLRLRRMGLRGVAGFSHKAGDGTEREVVNELLDDGVHDAIRAAVGEHVELVVVPHAMRCFWRADDSYGHGVPLVEDDDSEYDV